MASFRYLTVELRFTDASPEEVATALVPPEIESDREGFFNACFVWGENLILELPRSATGSEWGVSKRDPKRAETKRERWLTEGLREYDQIERAVFNYFYDTPMCGYFCIYRRSTRGDFVEIETFEYGQGASYFSLPRDYVMEAVDYIQAKYGIHLLSHNDLAYPRSRAWDFEVKRIC